jgi:hypothetical protein
VRFRRCNVFFIRFIWCLYCLFCLFVWFFFLLFCFLLSSFVCLLVLLIGFVCIVCLLFVLLVLSLLFFFSPKVLTSDVPELLKEVEWLRSAGSSIGDISLLKVKHYEKFASAQSVELQLLLLDCFALKAGEDVVKVRKDKQGKGLLRVCFFFFFVAENQLGQSCRFVLVRVRLSEPINVD